MCSRLRYSRNSPQPLSTTPTKDCVLHETKGLLSVYLATQTMEAACLLSQNLW